MRHWTPAEWTMFLPVLGTFLVTVANLILGALGRNQIQADVATAKKRLDEHEENSQARAMVHEENAEKRTAELKAAGGRRDR